MSGIDRYLIFTSNGGMIDSLEISAADFSGFTYSEIPVPAAIWLFGSALLGLLATRRKTSGLL